MGVFVMAYVCVCVCVHVQGEFSVLVFPERVWFAEYIRTHSGSRQW